MDVCVDYGEVFAQNIQIILVFLINIQKILNGCEFFLIFYNNMFLCASAIQCFMWQRKTGENTTIWG